MIFPGNNSIGGGVGLASSCLSLSSSSSLLELLLDWGESSNKSDGTSPDSLLNSAAVVDASSLNNDLSLHTQEQKQNTSALQSNVDSVWESSQQKSPFSSLNKDCCIYSISRNHSIFRDIGMIYNTALNSVLKERWWNTYLNLHLRNPEVCFSDNSLSIERSLSYKAHDSVSLFQRQARHGGLFLQATQHRRIVDLLVFFIGLALIFMLLTSLQGFQFCNKLRPGLSMSPKESSTLSMPSVVLLPRPQPILLPEVYDTNDKMNRIGTKRSIFMMLLRGRKYQDLRSQIQKSLPRISTSIKGLYSFTNFISIY